MNYSVFEIDLETNYKFLMNQNTSTNDLKIVIRKAQNEDMPFFEKLYFETRKDEFALLGWAAVTLENLLKMQFNVQNQGYRMQFPDARFFLIEVNNAAVGRLITTDEIRLVDIALLPDSRNLGIGSFVLDGLLKQAEEKKKSVFLQVLKTNVSAFRLYKRFGFKVIGEDDLYLSMERKNSSAEN